MCRFTVPGPLRTHVHFGATTCSVEHNNYKHLHAVHQLPKLRVESLSPFARSNDIAHFRYRFLVLSLREHESHVFSNRPAPQMRQQNLLLLVGEGAYCVPFLSAIGRR